ncbi:MAG: hypothetical protein Tsb0020_34440 [Haliangiales bacterium]
MSSDNADKTLGKRALGRVFAALNRADEIGGEVRDFVQDRVLRDPRYVDLRRRFEALRGKEYQSREDAEGAERARAEAAAAAAPAYAPSSSVADDAIANPDLPAQIYGKSSCPWTGRAITLLEKLRADYDFIDTDDSDNEHFESKLIAETDQKTTPWIYLRGQFIGGFNALNEVHRLGQLEDRLAGVVSSNPGDKNVVVAARPEAEVSPPGEAN